MPGVRQTTTGVVRTTGGIVDSAFKPDHIASLAHWYDATKLSGFADGNSVGTWPDEEGTDDLTQGTGSKQPAYKIGIANGKPVVRFDGTDDILQTGAFGSTVTQPVHIFGVTAQRSAPTNAQEYHWDGNSTNEMMMNGNTDAIGNDFSMFAGVNLRGNTEDTNFHVWGCLYNSTNSVFREDGAQAASGDTGTNDLNGFTVGARGDDASHGDIDAAELIIYDAELSSAEVSSVESYLSDKWGVTLA